MLTAWVAHVVVIAIGLVLLCLFFVLLLKSHRKQRRPSRILLSLLAALSFGFIVCSLVSVWVASLIAEEAESIAGNKAYCIQVATTEGSYRPVAALLDLSPLMMHTTKSNGANLQYRALLIVGDGPRLQVYNWSYRSFTFDDGSGLWNGAPIGGPVIRCSPEARFAAALPIVGSDEEPVKYIRLNDYEFRIPSGYRPAPTSGHNPTLIVWAVVPEFMPLRQLNGRADVRAMVEIQLSPTAPLERYLPMGGSELPDQTEEFGLRKVRYRSASGTTSVVYSLDTSGIMETLIVCGAPRAEPVLCQHYFVHKGIQYMFFHASDTMKDWREMQLKLIARVRGWRTGTE